MLYVTNYVRARFISTIRSWFNSQHELQSQKHNKNKTLTPPIWISQSHILTQVRAI